MKKQIIIIIVVVVLLLSGAIIFLGLNKKSSVSNSINEYQSVFDSIQNTYTLTPSTEDKKNNVYTDTQYGFSFQYPKSFTASKFSEGEGDAILVQYQGASNSINEYPKNSGFQIFIAPFDEPLPTKERILQELPDMVINNIENRVLKNGIPALIFFSEDSSSLGKTREIWFVKSGYLYQITATKEIDNLVAQIVATWRFAN